MSENIIGGKYMRDKVLRDFSDVVPNYYDYIKWFSQSFRDLGSNITLKIYIVEHHVEEFIVMKGGKFGKERFGKEEESLVSVYLEKHNLHI